MKRNMQLVIFAHPEFSAGKSMLLFSAMLSRHFKDALVISPAAVFSRLPAPQSLKKWLGYIDQYIVFMVMTWLLIKKLPNNTLYIFADQALGIWLPLVKHRPHAIHCHDFMALRSALGDYEENRLRLTGKAYQRLIRWGFSQGKNFISVSKATHDDLHSCAKIIPDDSIIIYNGLNYPYRPMTEMERCGILESAGMPFERHGMLLHIGGDLWYKNRVGVIELYAAYASKVSDPLPLWMIGPIDQPDVMEAMRLVPERGVVKQFSGLSGPVLNAVYAQARLLIFPSLSEGFGWPIVEAMAAGTLVLTTDLAPMTEVGGGAAFYHYRRTHANVEKWAYEGGSLIHEILSLSASERLAKITDGMQTASRFTEEMALLEYRSFYERVLAREGFHD